MLEYTVISSTVLAEYFIDPEVIPSQTSSLSKYELVRYTVVVTGTGAGVGIGAAIGTGTQYSFVIILPSFVNCKATLDCKLFGSDTAHQVLILAVKGIVPAGSVKTLVELYPGISISPIVEAEGI